MLPITSLYAAILAFMLLGLSIHVIRGRRAYKVGLADGGEKELLRRIRAQANFCEYVPFILLLLALAELQNAMHPLLHAIGLLVVIGRSAHMYSLLYAEPHGKGFRMRVTGMVLTFMALALGGAYTLYVAIMG